MEQRRMDYHLHTVHSMDGRQTMDELCQSMVEKGVQEICLTEHIEPGHPQEGIDVPPIWDLWWHEIEAMRKKYPTLVIRAGVEIGDNPLLRPSIQAMLDAQPFDYRLLSLHLVNGVDCYDKEAYFGGKTRAQAYRAYAEAKAESVCAWTDFDSVAHIGYVAKFSAYTGDERPLRYQDAPDAFDTICKRIIQLDKCLEINTSTYGAMGAPLPEISIIKRYIELGGTCFTFGSDSHDTGRNYADVERAKEWVKSLGGKYQASFRQRKKFLYRI